MERGWSVNEIWHLLFEFDDAFNNTCGWGLGQLVRFLMEKLEGRK